MVKRTYTLITGEIVDSITREQKDFFILNVPGWLINKWEKDLLSITPENEISIINIANSGIINISLSPTAQKHFSL